MTKFFLPVFFILFCSTVFAQKPEIEKVYKPDSAHSPRKAAFMSLVIPGSGQVYNHSFWKFPLVYAGLGTFVSTLVYNQGYYNKFIAVAIIVRTGSVPKPRDANYNLYKKYKAAYNQFSYMTEDQLVNLSSQFQRDRDLSILGVLGWWGLNVLDAYIEAKFVRSYTMDNNLAFRISSGFVGGDVYAANGTPPMPALKITLSY